MCISKKKVDQFSTLQKNFNEKYSMHKIVMSTLGVEVAPTPEIGLQLEELLKLWNDLKKKITHGNKQFQTKKRANSSKADRSRKTTYNLTNSSSIFYTRRSYP